MITIHALPRSRAPLVTWTKQGPSRDMMFSLFLSRRKGRKDNDEIYPDREIPVRSRGSKHSTLQRCNPSGHHPLLDWKDDPWHPSRLRSINPNWSLKVSSHLSVKGRISWYVVTHIANNSCLYREKSRSLKMSMMPTERRKAPCNRWIQIHSSYPDIRRQLSISFFDSPNLVVRC